MTASAKIEPWMIDAMKSLHCAEYYTDAMAERDARHIAAHAPKQLDAEKLQRYISTDLGEVWSDNVTELEAVNDELWQAIKTLTTNYEFTHAPEQEWEAGAGTKMTTKLQRYKGRIRGLKLKKGGHHAY